MASTTIQYERVLRWFSENNDITFVSRNDFNPNCLFETENICIKITDYSYSDNSASGKVLIESKETFYDWSNVYYISDLPLTKGEFDVIIKDLPLLITEEHLWKSDNFYKFFPERP